MTGRAAYALVLVSALALPSCDTAPPEPRPSAAAPVTTAPATTPAPTRSPTPKPTTRTYVAPVGRYRSPNALARAVIDADRVLHDRTADAASTARAGQAQQRAYRQLALTPGWQAAAYAALPAGLRADARDCVLAATELRAATSPRTELPPWRIVPAAPEPELLRYYRESGARHGIHWTYLAAINLVETRMGRLRGTSSAGARGPMQFLPSTWAEVGRGDIDDPRDAIDAAARYLVRRGGREDIARGVRGYNPTEHYVRAVLAYARVLRRDATAYRGFYHWQVYYRMATGDVVLLEGYNPRER
ncbi:MAG TPA: transglycosylase SLT domain-containing protein [Frankiaceae bacterium]|nr:transglycosylase SLT domain-containing protein [Frankiaceae bacterium]